MIDPAEIGRRVAAARGYGGVSQERLAEVLGLSQSTMVRLEAGRRGLKPFEEHGMLPLIASTCDLPLEFFTADFERLGEIPAQRASLES